ncbi:MAG: GAF domain-containing protein [Bacillota bacterium]
MYRAKKLDRREPKFYEAVNYLLDRLIGDEDNALANLCNAAALLGHQLDEVTWVGFYLRRGDELVLGPFQGKPACVHIPIGQGVCGVAAARRETVLVADVHQFPGHIACDAASRSEIVVPILVAGELVAVLDIDAPVLSRFDETDRAGLEEFCRRLAVGIDWSQLA